MATINAASKPSRRAIRKLSPICQGSLTHGPAVPKSSVVVRSVVVRDARPVGRTLLEERVAALGGLIGHVREARGFAGKTC